MEVTSRDFRAIASIIAELPEPRRTDVAGIFADKLATTNERFDRERFLAAATGAPLTKGDKPRASDYAR